MDWNYLRSLEDFEQLKKEATNADILIFKHSTRCNVSADSLAHIEQNWSESTKAKPYFLDLLNYREISDQIETDFGVRHQSPQILLIRGKQCIYNESHWRIDVKKIEEKLAQN